MSRYGTTRYASCLPQSQEIPFVSVVSSLGTNRNSKSSSIAFTTTTVSNTYTQSLSSTTLGGSILPSSIGEAKVGTSVKNIIRDTSQNMSVGLWRTRNIPVVIAYNKSLSQLRSRVTQGVSNQADNYLLGLIHTQQEQSIIRKGKVISKGIFMAPDGYTWTYFEVIDEKYIEQLDSEY